LAPDSRAEKIDLYRKCRVCYGFVVVCVHRRNDSPGTTDCGHGTASCGDRRAFLPMRTKVVGTQGSEGTHEPACDGRMWL
jgi:hypothetical protein